jgi:hypothetical protein
MPSDLHSVFIFAMKMYDKFKGVERGKKHEVKEKQVIKIKE